ncbi:MAG: 16S rRNA (guanine(966)-N(2))-methyltransferase RsmD [Candidatus Pelagibacter sp. TMED128]|nr:MAG: 16S rRNA (guanine(966)-N(2))-methyltransferase RsmD [Candidatus Pelagibacter sp. TMED128]|tara:strand:+ start:1288 stop:1851 length:564 start_codon:yes stop_codon:yes gene_type:complete
MRIISGKLKGKSIDFLKSNTTRPLKDSVKENIFNIITHSNLIKVNFEKSNVLDLYSGIGSFGLECISRGADKITFVEKNKIAVDILKKNLLRLSLENKSIVVQDEISNFLKSKLEKKFEIIFLDPPFKKDDYINDLELIRKKKIYKKNHILIIHREKKSLEVLPKIVDTILIKTYGRSKIIFSKFLS